MFSCLVVEGGEGHAAVLCGLCQSDFSVPPMFALLLESLGELLPGASELYAALLGGGDALGLPLADAHALVLCYEGQHLEHDVAEKGSHEVFSPACVQEGHVQNDDVRSHVLGDASPFLQDFRIVPPQTVNGVDVEQGILVEMLQEPLVFRTVEVLAGYAVKEDPFLWDFHFPHGGKLPVCVLFSRAHAHIAIYFLHNHSPLIGTCNPHGSNHIPSGQNLSEEMRGGSVLIEIKGLLWYS